MITMYKILLCVGVWIAHCHAQYGPSIEDSDINLLTETLLNLLSTSQVTAGSGVPVTNQYGISSSPSSLSPPDQIDLSAYGSGAVSQQPQTIVYQQTQAKPLERRVSGQTYGVYIIQPISGEQQPLLGYEQSAPQQSSQDGGYGTMPATSNYGVTIQVAPTYLPVSSAAPAMPSGYGSQSQPSGYGSQPSGYGSQPSGYGSQPSGYGSQPSGGEAQPSGYRSNGYQQQQPQYSAPQPQYPAPQPQYSAPQAQYPASQPQYPAPAPQYPAPQPRYPAPQPHYPAPKPKYPQKPRYSPPKYLPKKRKGYGKPKPHYGYGKPKKRYYMKPELIEIPKGYVPDFDDLNPHEKNPVPHINKLFLA